MFDLSIYKEQYFETKIDENNTINLETPHEALLNKLISLQNNTTTENIVETLYSVVLDCLNINKEKKEFAIEDVKKMFNINALYGFLSCYFQWVMDNLNQKN